MGLERSRLQSGQSTTALDPEHDASRQQLHTSFTGIFNPRGIGKTTNSRKTSVKFTYNKNILPRWLKEL